ncbi:MAG: RsmD family RNA methyltransferase [Lentisphaeria bacterium]|nr:RsmD family RNA methyltransferase [Lentisphaeria bacterium]
MEIAGGIARGTILEVPRGMDVRPTAIRARKALFDSLGDLSGKRICDLFAGSGALGLEAVSRGAASLVSVEEAPSSIAVIRKNMKNVALRVGWEINDTALSPMRLIQGKLPQCIKMVVNTPVPDIIFADPPYIDSTNAAAGLLENKDFLQWSEASLLIWELPDKGTLITGLPAERQILDIRKYGAIRFMFIAKK